MGVAYGEAPPPAALARRVACLWWLSAGAAGDRAGRDVADDPAGSLAAGDQAGREAGDGLAGPPAGDDDRRVAVASPSAGHAVLPDGAIDLVWHAGRLTIAGPDTHARTAPAGGPSAVGVRLRPGAAATFRESAAALRDRQPSAEDLWDAPGRRLTERVADAPDPRSRLRILVTATERLVAQAPSTDPLVDGAVGALMRGGTGVAAVASDVGLSERQLRRRFHEHVGHGPKALDRILRLQRFLTLAITTDESLAGLAARAGYADQAHLGRETRALAGATAAELVASRRPGG